MQTKDGLTIYRVKTPQEGISIAKDLLCQAADKKTAIFLSGGKTPKNLYESLSQEHQFKVGAAAMCDERFGEKFHKDSNELMIKNTGLLRYFELTDIPFYPILQKQKEAREKTAEIYEERVRSLMSTFPKSVAITGVGTDGHTVGLPSQNSKFKSRNSELTGNSYDLVTSFVDRRSITEGGYGSRITLTFLGLSFIDQLIVLVFDSAKRGAIEKMFEKGSLEEIPARIYTQKEIAKKTVLITDQRV